jgi:hypothetical protein
MDDAAVHWIGYLQSAYASVDLDRGDTSIAGSHYPVKEVRPKKLITGRP